MSRSLFVRVFLWTAVSCVGAFQVVPVASLSRARASPPSALFLSSSGDEPAKRRRKRVKRKEPIETAAVPDLKPRNDAPVELQIQDVRDVVSQSSTPSTPSSSQQQQGSGDAGAPQSSGNLQDNSNAGSVGDSLEQVLADAKAMRKNVEDSADDDNEKEAIQETVRNILSTIVTVDFFVVCALLVWFLAGIFGSYVLKNDAVQIAFNGIFQQVVQPALGILMIGSVASGTSCMWTMIGFHL